LHKNKGGDVNLAEILLFKKAYDAPPWYGEIEYTGRMARLGWYYTP
jgi:hypothetical protein